MALIDLFNTRMIADNRRFRLIRAAAHGPVGAPSAASYEVRRLNPPGDSGFVVCHRIHNAPEQVAVQLAEAFVSGVDWARREARKTDTHPETLAV